MSAPPTDGLRREHLPNGVTLLVQRCGTAPAVTVVTHVRAGFLDEPDVVVGISHVLEHMLFKGTPSLGPGELARRTKALGGALNAYTAYDRTVYYASAPARHMAELVALQADQVQHASIDAGELQRELGVIIQEAGRKLDTPGAVAGETLHELLYATHRLRRWRIGVAAGLAQLTHDDVAAYYRSRYVPSRVIVALVGAIEVDEALDTLRRQWGAWSGPAAEIAPGPAEQGIVAVHARRLSGDVVLADLVLGWRAPGVLDAGIPALDVASAVLGTGRGARLPRLLRDTGLVSSVGVGSYGVVDAGVFAIGAELVGERIPAVLEVIGEAIDDLAGHGPDDAEFGRALALLRSRLARQLERFESRAIALAEAEALGDVTRLDREEADLLAVTPAMVQDVARRGMAPDGVSAVAYLPRQSDLRFDDDVLRHAMRAAGTPGAPPAAAPRHAMAAPIAAGPDPLAAQAVAGGTVPARPRSPPTTGVAPLQIHHVALDGIDILAARFGATGQTSLSFSRLRADRVTPATAGLAALAVRTMLRGTHRHDAAELAFAMESLGGSIFQRLGADLLGFGATVLSEHAGEAAAILAEVLCEPRFDPAALAIERALLLDDARAVADDMVRFPVQLALGVGFDDADYGAPALGTAESIAALDLADVRRWHRGMLDAGRTTIIAVGDTDPERLAAEVADRAGGLVRRGTARGGTSGPAGPLAIRSGMRAERRDRQQSALAMLFPGPAHRDPLRFVAETWAAIAAGLGGRLFEALRSRRSLAYTVIASSWQRQRAGGLLTYIATEPARLDEARDAMLAELDLFRREPPSRAELDRAIATLVGEVEMSRQTAGALAAEIAEAWLLGGGLQDLEDPAAPYRGVTAEAVHGLAVRCLDPEARAEGVVIAATG